MTRSSKRSSIDAAAERNISLPSLPSSDAFDAKPFVPIAPMDSHSFPQQKPSLTQQGMNQAAASTAGKKIAQFPPIKATGLVPTTVSTPKQSKSKIETSPHAREQASIEQRLSDDYDLEDKA